MHTSLHPDGGLPHGVLELSSIWLMMRPVCLLISSLSTGSAPSTHNHIMSACTTSFDIALIFIQFSPYCAENLAFKKCGDDNLTFFSVVTIHKYNQPEYTIRS